MAKTFVNGNALPASDLNTNMIQPGTVGTGTRIVSGTATAAFSTQSAVSGTITYGLTFGGTPKVIATVQIGSNFDVAINLTGAPGTSSVGYRLFQVGGVSISGTATINWLAIGPA